MPEAFWGYAGKGFRQVLLLVFLPALVLRCGPIEVAGGTSEVGNPTSAIYKEKDKGEDSASTKVTGIQISAQGAPIRLIEEEK